jgi:hypothetical protein
MLRVHRVTFDSLQGAIKRVSHCPSDRDCLSVVAAAADQGEVASEHTLRRGPRIRSGRPSLVPKVGPTLSRKGAYNRSGGGEERVSIHCYEPEKAKGHLTQCSFEEAQQLTKHWAAS